MSSLTPSWISRSRAPRGSRGRVRITPHSTRLTRIAPSPATTPYPVWAVPGSMPRTITSSRLPGHVAHVDVEVRPDFLHVVELLERLDEPEHRFGIFPFDVHGVFWHHRKLRLGDLETARLERRADRMKRCRLRRHDVLA